MCLEGYKWDLENQKKYQILLIQNRKYGYGRQQFYNGLSQDKIDLLNDLSRDLSFEEARGIFNAKNYEDPPMRGRQSINPLKKIGLVSTGSDKVTITGLGKLFLKDHFDIGEVVSTLKQLNFKINNIITWYKTNAVPNMTRRVFTHSTEFVVWAVKGSGWVFDYKKMKEINPNKQKDGSPKQMRDLWELPLVQGKERLRGKDERALHPTQKPEEMLKRIILATSQKGGVVLDPFLGSGTTTFVAKKYGRQWIGIEKDKKYVDLAQKRMENN